MATNVRFPEALHAQAQAYARELGISLNALLAVALREYLDRRGPVEVQARPVEVQARPLESGSGPGSGSGEDGARFYPGNRRGRCGCGSGQQWRHCHGR